MPRTVGEVMADVKVRMGPQDDLRALAVALSAARTGLGIVDIEGGGVITERDVLRAIAEGTDLDAAQVADWMTPDPVAVERATPLDDACELMIARGVRHLLVRDGAELVGVLNMRDVVGVLSGAAELGAVPPARGS
ncbi:MAG TPA: CBS domain-containing protein [Miltoncostaeaceae bacterium]|nr:CBS domain-containing protein [Miltoncostaeaceae bacterium]